MTKIEEVARALWSDRHPDVEPWPSDIDRMNYLGHARAAIVAMREPTKEMLDSVQTEVDICDESKERPSSNYVEFMSREEALSTWQAGIDAALRDTG